uniref:Uncharacterized protein n=1 Tax=Cacopsylla melanoneura TaxID=428564 RepID=A0A8D8U863_9HEMI
MVLHHIVMELVEVYGFDHVVLELWRALLMLLMVVVMVSSIISSTFTLSFSSCSCLLKFLIGLLLLICIVGFYRRFDMFLIMNFLVRFLSWSFDWPFLTGLNWFSQGGWCSCCTRTAASCYSSSNNFLQFNIRLRQHSRGRVVMIDKYVA